MRYGQVVSLHERFVAEVAREFGQVAGPELLPVVLAASCTAVLPVDGAGLSLTDHLRLPLAASDDVAARAERLQTTLADGPGLDAAAASTPLIAGPHVMAARCPMFHRELVNQT